MRVTKIFELCLHKVLTKEKCRDKIKKLSPPEARDDGRQRKHVARTKIGKHKVLDKMNKT